MERLIHDRFRDLAEDREGKWVYNWLLLVGKFFKQRDYCG